jgi:hypothetical protein
MACYRDSFTLPYLYIFVVKIQAMYKEVHASGIAMTVSPVLLCNRERMLGM